jgi:hypothetical protein
MSANPLFSHMLTAIDIVFRNEPPSPRLGANIIVVDGRNVEVWVEGHAGEYRASEMDYDLGRPVSMGSSIPWVLWDMGRLLMDEITECTACTDGECETHDEDM